MNRITKLRNRLNMYYDAEAAILRGAEYTIGDRKLRRANLAEVRQAITDLETEIDMILGVRVRRVMFVD